MGTALTSLSEVDFDNYIKKELARSLQLKSEEDHLLLTEVINYSQELPDMLQYDFNHLGSLYWLDHDKDGKFSINDFARFSKIWVERSKLCK